MVEHLSDSSEVSFEDNLNQLLNKVLDSGEEFDSYSAIKPVIDLCITDGTFRDGGFTRPEAQISFRIMYNLMLARVRIQRRLSAFESEKANDNITGRARELRNTMDHYMSLLKHS